MLNDGTEEVGQVPERCAISALSGGCHEDTNDRTDDGVGGGAEDLAFDGVLWPASESCIVVLVQYTCTYTPDRADDAVQNSPSSGGVLYKRLVGDRVAEAGGPHGSKSPDQKDELKDQYGACGNVEEDL